MNLLLASQAKPVSFDSSTSSHVQAGEQHVRSHSEATQKVCSHVGKLRLQPSVLGTSVLIVSCALRPLSYHSTYTER